MAIERQTKRARHWAAEIVEAWIEGRPTAPIIDAIPEPMRDAAKVLARNSCQKIQAHARNPLPEYKGALRGLGEAVQRYKNRVDNQKSI